MPSGWSHHSHNVWFMLLAWHGSCLLLGKVISLFIVVHEYEEDDASGNERNATPCEILSWMRKGTDAIWTTPRYNGWVTIKVPHLPTTWSGINDDTQLRSTGHDHTGYIQRKNNISGWTTPFLKILVNAGTAMGIIMMITLADAHQISAASDVTQKVMLVEGNEGIIQFYKEWPPESTSYQYFDIRMKEESRPFCINGEINPKSRENMDRLDRLSIEFDKSVDSLSVDVTLNPVSTSDQGEYVMSIIVYGTQIVSYRVKANVTVVHRPPEEMMCYFLKSVYADYLYEIRCHARLVNDNNTLTCFQLGVKLPYINNAIQRRNKILRRSFWAISTTAFSCCTHHVTEVVTDEICSQFRWPFEHAEGSHTSETTVVHGSSIKVTPTFDNYDSINIAPIAVPGVWVTFMFSLGSICVLDV